MVPVTFPNFLTDRRSQIVLELFTTERTYVRGLETMIEVGYHYTQLIFTLIKATVFIMDNTSTLVRKD
jgi:hypothetical protein